MQFEMYVFDNENDSYIFINNSNDLNEVLNNTIRYDISELYINGYICNIENLTLEVQQDLYKMLLGETIDNKVESNEPEQKELTLKEVYNTIYSLKLKRGDVVKIINQNNNEFIEPIEKVLFGSYPVSQFYSNKDYETLLIIETNSHRFIADKGHIKNIEIVSRSKRSKIVLLDKSKTFKPHMDYWFK